VRAAFSAFESKRWGDFAALVHPEALSEFRKQHLVIGEQWEQRPRMTELQSSSMPSAVAEYFVQMHDELSTRFGNPVLREFARVKSLQELKALLPQEFLARYLEATGPKADPDDPDYQPPVAEREVIGDVTESTSLVHVVYRVRTDVGRYGRTERVEVVSVRRDTAGWRIMLNNDLSFNSSMATFSIESDPSDS
jgi:hypothetical protein